MICAFFPFWQLTESHGCRLVSTDSQVIESSEVGSVVHSKPFAFPVLNFVFHVMSDYGFEQFDLFIKCGLGDGHDVA